MKRKDEKPFYSNHFFSQDFVNMTNFENLKNEV